MLCCIYFSFYFFYDWLTVRKPQQREESNSATSRDSAANIKALEEQKFPLHYEIVTYNSTVFVFQTHVLVSVRLFMSDQRTKQKQQQTVWEGKLLVPKIRTVLQMLAM